MFRLYWWRKGQRHRVVLALWAEPVAARTAALLSARVWASPAAWDKDWSLGGTRFSRN
jgi:hypothetical protein